MLTWARSCLTQVVDAIIGNFLDSATYTKPYGWKTNMTRQLATIANYVNGSYVAVPYEDAGAPDYGARPHNLWLLCVWYAYHLQQLRLQSGIMHVV